MVKTNSWGRKIKDIISVTFKKDEEDLKSFLNEQPNPADYIKMLIAKDMKNINFCIKHQIVSKEEVEHSITEKKQDIEMKLSDESMKKIMLLMDDE